MLSQPRGSQTLADLLRPPRQRRGARLELCRCLNKDHSLLDPSQILDGQGDFRLEKMTCKAVWPLADGMLGSREAQGSELRVLIGTSWVGATHNRSVPYQCSLLGRSSPCTPNAYMQISHGLMVRIGGPFEGGAGSVRLLMAVCVACCGDCWRLARPPSDSDMEPVTSWLGCKA